MDVFDALADEYAALHAMLSSLDERAWEHPSLCEGWTVADVVLHLAQSEELAAGGAPTPSGGWSPSPRASTIDEIVAERVAAERGLAPDEILGRWRAASSVTVDKLRTADPDALFPWATNPLKPRTLATTRLAEHWIHANDIAEPLGVPYPDTDRLWHIARLAHRTIPYAYGRAGRGDPPSVCLELQAPSGERWTFGGPDAECTVRGSASELCRVAGRRLDTADAATITTSGARAPEVLSLIRTYA